MASVMTDKTFSDDILPCKLNKHLGSNTLNQSCFTHSQIYTGSCPVNNIKNKTRRDWSNMFYLIFKYYK